MSHSVSILERAANVGESLTGEKVFSSTNLAKLEEVIAADASDAELVWAVDVSAIKAIVIVADQDLTLETNSGAAPDNTLSLKADVPYIWHTDSYFSNVFTVDITALFVTNGSGVATTLKAWTLTDATP